MLFLSYLPVRKGCRTACMDQSVVRLTPETDTACPNEVNRTVATTLKEPAARETLLLIRTDNLAAGAALIWTISID